MLYSMVMSLWTRLSLVKCRWFFLCFKEKTAYEMRISDWSSDVCSSDLILHRRDFVLPHRPARVMRQKLVVQPQLRLARGIGRQKLGPRKIGLQEGVGQQQAAVGVAVEQMVAGRNPEIPHFRSRIRVTMSTSSPGASSSSTSMKRKAVAGSSWPSLG